MKKIHDDLMTRAIRVLILTALWLTASFTVSAATQTIAFDPIPNQILGISPLVIAAQASSGLPVTFASTMPAVCKLADDLVTLLSVGTCSITASQAGNTNFSPASAIRSFTVVTAKKSGSFMAAPGSPFPAGTGVGQMLVVGDFNEDGIPDLAIANSGINSYVSVLLGTGLGGFIQAAGSPIAIDSLPGGIVAGDFNGDGLEDLAITEGGNAVAIMLGNGLGGFTAAAGIALGANTGSGAIAVGDFNGDGIQDLAAVDGSVSGVTVLLGNGSGVFAATQESPIPVGQIPGGLVVGDFNGDGIQDIVTLNIEGQNLTVLLGNGSGGFSEAPFSPVSLELNTFATSLVTGDFNGDGVQDLAMVNIVPGSVTVLLGKTSGGFAAPISTPVTQLGNPDTLVVGDFNGDGIEDIATASAVSNGLVILLGRGTGHFVASPYSPVVLNSGAGILAPGDFNGDGIEDIALGTFPTSGISVLLGFAAGNTAQSINFGALSAVTYGVAPFAVSATASSGLAVSFGSLTPFTCTIAGNTVTIVYATQTCSIVASQAGNPTYAAAATVTQSFTVYAGPQTITFGALSDLAVGSGPVTLTATASSGLPVTYASTTPGVCSVAGNMATILTSGGCSITATQAGDAIYTAATPVTLRFTVFFSDVAPTDSDYAAINAMAQHGITAGCGSNGFCPDLNVTRDEMAIFIVRAIYGNDNFTYTTTPYFTDVTPSTFGFKWIQKLKDLGITNGCTATTYCPLSVIARDQMAVFIIRARLGLGLAGPNPTFSYPSTPYFTDAAAGSEFAYPWIQRMKLDAITNGCTATTYCPTAPVTRGQMAIFIMRGAFNQFLPVGTPVISQISPSTLARGTSGTFTITGVNSNFVQGTTVVSPIPGVTVGTVTVMSATSLTVQLTADSNAVAQPYSILAITGAEQDVLPNGLMLQ